MVRVPFWLVTEAKIELDRSFRELRATSLITVQKGIIYLFSLFADFIGLSNPLTRSKSIVGVKYITIKG